MNEIGYGYWTREASNIESWVKTFLKFGVKFKMTAYRENYATIVYMFRTNATESTNDMLVHRFGFEHSFVIHSGLKKESDAECHGLN